MAVKLVLLVLIGVKCLHAHVSLQKWHTFTVENEDEVIWEEETIFKRIEGYRPFKAKPGSRFVSFNQCKNFGSDRGQTAWWKGWCFVEEKGNSLHKCGQFKHGHRTYIHDMERLYFIREILKHWNDNSIMDLPGDLAFTNRPREQWLVASVQHHKCPAIDLDSERLSDTDCQNGNAGRVLCQYPACEDQRSRIECKQRAKWGDCLINRKWMELLCQQTCFCGRQNETVKPHDMPPLKNCHVDVIFVIDSSGLGHDFQERIQFVRSLSESFKISRNIHHATLILYATDTEDIQIFPDIPDKQHFDDLLEGLLPLPHGEDNIIRTLDGIYYFVAKKKFDAVPALIIFVTEGYNDAAYEYITWAMDDIRSLGSEKVTTFAAGINEGPNKNELFLLAGDFDRVFVGHNAVKKARKALSGYINYCSDVSPTEETTMEAETTTESVVFTMESETTTKSDTILEAETTTISIETSPESESTMVPEKTRKVGKTTKSIEITTQLETTTRFQQPIKGKVCHRLPYRAICENGGKSQMVLRWYAVEGQCLMYAWGYCRGDRVMEEKSHRLKQTCQCQCLKKC